MQYNPHQKRKDRCAAITILLIASVIALAAFGCTKTNPLDTEPAPADHSVRERQKKLVFPDYGIGCDTTLNGGL